MIAQSSLKEKISISTPNQPNCQNDLYSRWMQIWMMNDEWWMQDEFKDECK